MHKESTSAYIQKYVKENHPGLEAELLHKISFDLPSTYKFHKKSKIYLIPIFRKCNNWGGAG